MYKLGLDIHGTIDDDPMFFIDMARVIQTHGGEVHIITGAPFDNEAWERIRGYNKGKKWWDHSFSIVQELQNEGYVGTKNKKGSWEFDKTIWNQAKGLYCFKNWISLHIDDSLDYGEYFVTPYLLYKKNTVCSPITT